MAARDLARQKQDEAEMVEALRASLRGEAIDREDPGYLNCAGLGDEEEDGVRAAALGAHAERLERTRQAYDPDGLFEAAARQP